MTDINYHFNKSITLEQAFLGGYFKIRTAQGVTLKVKIKPGSYTGKIVRLNRIEKNNECLANNILIKLHVLDHPLYKVEGLNLTSTLIITPADAKLGTTKKIPAPDGKEITVKILPNSKTEHEIIIKNAGLKDKSKTGHIIYKLQFAEFNFFDEVLPYLKNIRDHSHLN